ncbi:helix-turn-helix domain-containing protein [Streptomyces scabiei]|uniref:helix-turn-helix domain-containing protein n=1 Tax=Streptomyces scabiei TaxID=1930 RepID=UPI0029B2ABE3|nr:helix-turn-helix domain-containing protein [Streptomyces scabiei]MDX3521823.1 helix-turn-helix domain-containing protein [Streptomyces scabiei]
MRKTEENVSGSGTENGLGADFAELLRELKDRSGLSYGALAKRLHMSTSTLHRYCNGDAVPTDYAPVERLARLCRATPDELVELHRRWVLADATRRRKGSDSGAAAAAPRAAAPEERAPEETAPAAEAERRPDPGEGAAPGESTVPVETLVGGGGSVRAGVRLPARRRTRVALVAGLAVTAVLGAVTLAMSLPSDAEGQGTGARRAGDVSVGVRESPGEAGGPDRSAPSVTLPSGSWSGTGDKDAKGATEGKGTGEAGASSAGSTPSGSGAKGADASRSAPLSVKVEPYTWESPCSQRYLTARPPAEVGPPPLEQDAGAWVSSAGAVSSGEQFLTLTVQGSGKETVVVRSLTVRTVDKRSPLAWNDYAMGYPGVGCGAGVPTRSFTIALDGARPDVKPKSGTGNFPYSVSESDPETYYITADASAYYVSWYLELKWSSGSRSGTLVIDDGGRPFRTSGNNGRPAYEYPLGGPKWVKEGTTLGEDAGS